MASLSYPLTIRTVLRASKSRSEPAAFAFATPRRGLPYVRKLGTTPPQQWDVQFRFTPSEAVVFKLWFDEIIEGGELAFNMPLRTEAGEVTHEMQFLPDGLGDCVDEGNSFVYEARMVGVPV